jgi:hypothetical protein
MIQVKAPAPFAHLPRPFLFLAGSIEMDRAERWQDHVVAALAGSDVTILNPRRDAWDASWRCEIDEPQFREQVEWELEALEAADVVLVYFAPDTRAPIALLELGLHARAGKAIVCCPAGFWRKGNVDVVCARYGVQTEPDLSSLVGAARIRLQHV